MECKECGGIGIDPNNPPDPNQPGVGGQPCEKCNGTGKVEESYPSVVFKRSCC